MLVDTFKGVYKQLDPQKKGYIKLKDLSEAVKGVEGECKRNALIKFFVSFINQTQKHYISKVSFLTNAVSACLHNKYDLNIFIQNLNLKPPISNQLLNKNDKPLQTLQKQQDFQQQSNNHTLPQHLKSLQIQTTNLENILPNSNNSKTNPTTTTTQTNHIQNILNHVIHSPTAPDINNNNITYQHQQQQQQQLQQHQQQQQKQQQQHQPQQQQQQFLSNYDQIPQHPILLQILHHIQQNEQSQQKLNDQQLRELKQHLDQWLEQYTANQQQLQQYTTFNNQLDILRTFDTQDSQSTTRPTMNQTALHSNASNSNNNQQYLGNQKSLEDDINMLYYKYFSGRVSKSNQLSKQNELYIQHLLAQSQAYQQQKKIQQIISPSSSNSNLQSNKENNINMITSGMMQHQQQQQIFPNNNTQKNLHSFRDSHSQQRSSHQSRNENKNVKQMATTSTVNNKIANFTNNSNFSMAAKQLKTVRAGGSGLQPHPLRSSQNNRSLKQSQLNSTSEGMMMTSMAYTHSTFDSARGGKNKK